MVRPTTETVQDECIVYHNYRSGPLIYSTDSYFALERTYSGSQTPDYRSKRLKKEFIPPLAYTSNVIRRKVPQTHVSTRHLDYPYGVSESLRLDLLYEGAREPPLSYFDSQGINEAKNKMLRKLSAQLQNQRANLALMFVERRQTADLIASTATRVANAAVALKRADLRGFARSLNLSARDSAAVARGWRRVAETPVDKRLANHWLEYVFGWLPLLSDIHDAAELLAESIATRKEPKGSCRASGRSTASVSYSDPQTGLGHLYADYDVSASYTTRVKANYVLDNEARSVLSKTGISNPASLAWEALPFSFVIDWFLPVGNYLDSLTAMDGFTFDGVTYSMLENAVAQWRFGSYNQPGYAWSYTTTTGGKAVATQTRYTRTLSLPSYSFPSVRSPIGGEPLRRLLTATSLLVQKFRGKTSTTLA